MIDGAKRHSFGQVTSSFVCRFDASIGAKYLGQRPKSWDWEG